MDHATTYRDRAEAGRLLATELARLLGPRPGGVVVLALPRGGVPVAAPVADALDAPLEVLVARKLGAPGHEELGCGAIAEGLDRPVLLAEAAACGLTGRALEATLAAERLELSRRVERYRAGRPLPPVEGRVVIVVDDGLATGVTAEAACRAVRLAGPDRLILAVPVGAPETLSRLHGLVDDLVCPLIPARLGAVGAYYEDFRQVEDDEVLDLLASRGRAGRAERE